MAEQYLIEFRTRATEIVFRFVFWLLTLSATTFIAVYFLEFGLRPGKRSGIVTPFSVHHYEQYAEALLLMVGDTARLQIIAASLVAGAATYTTLGYLHGFAETFLKGRAQLDLDEKWQVSASTLPWRFAYRVTQVFDTLVLAWAGFNVFVAMNPTFQFTWDGFIKQLLFPVTVFTNTESAIGFLIHLLVTSALLILVHVLFGWSYARIRSLGGVVRR